MNDIGKAIATAFEEYDVNIDICSVNYPIDYSVGNLAKSSLSPFINGVYGVYVNDRKEPKACFCIINNKIITNIGTTISLDHIEMGILCLKIKHTLRLDVRYCKGEQYQLWLKEYNLDKEYCDLF